MTRLLTLFKLLDREPGGSWQAERECPSEEQSSFLVASKHLSRCKDRLWLPFADLPTMWLYVPRFTSFPSSSFSLTRSQPVLATLQRDTLYSRSLFKYAGSGVRVWGVCFQRIQIVLMKTNTFCLKTSRILSFSRSKCQSFLIWGTVRRFNSSVSSYFRDLGFFLHVRRTMPFVQDYCGSEGWRPALELAANIQLPYFSFFFHEYLLNLEIINWVCKLCQLKNHHLTQH